MVKPGKSAGINPSLANKTLAVGMSTLLVLSGASLPAYADESKEVLEDSEDMPFVVDLDLEDDLGNGEGSFDNGEKKNESFGFSSDTATNSKLDAEGTEENEEPEKAAESFPSEDPAAGTDAEFDESTAPAPIAVESGEDGSKLCEGASLEDLFPDEAFRAYIEKEVLVATDLNSGKLMPTGVKKIQDCTAINNGRYGATEGKIKDLSGIEYFTNLKKLDVGYNNLTGTLDLSKNEKLTSLNVRGNDISGTLDLSKNGKLQTLEIDNNPKLEGVVLSDKVKSSLWKIECQNTSITKLDVGGLENLVQLNCANTKITSLELNSAVAKTMTALELQGTGVKSLDLRKFTNLYQLNCSNPELQLTLPEKWETTAGYAIIEFAGAEVVGGKADLSGLEKLYQLNCSNCGLTELILPKCNYSVVQTVRCSNNNLTKLDVSCVGNLGVLECYGNPLKELTLSEKLPSDLKYSNTEVGGADLGTSSNFTNLYASSVSGTCTVAGELMITGSRAWNDYHAVQVSKSRAKTDEHGNFIVEKGAAYSYMTGMPMEFLPAGSLPQGGILNPEGLLIVGADADAVVPKADDVTGIPQSTVNVMGGGSVVTPYGKVDVAGDASEVVAYVDGSKIVIAGSELTFSNTRNEKTVAAIKADGEVVVDALNGSVTVPANTTYIVNGESKSLEFGGTIYMNGHIEAIEGNTYYVEHQYYTNGVLTGSKKDSYRAPLGTVVNASAVESAPMFGDNTYTRTEDMSSITVEKGEVKSLVIRYDRTVSTPQPQQPTTPTTPEQPTTPEDPQDPTTPTSPTTPTTPDTPSVPAEPQNPVAPTVPTSPTTPTVQRPTANVANNPTTTVTTPTGTTVTPRATTSTTQVISYTTPEAAPVETTSAETVVDEVTPLAADVAQDTAAPEEAIQDDGVALSAGEVEAQNGINWLPAALAALAAAVAGWFFFIWRRKKDDEEEEQVSIEA